MRISEFAFTYLSHSGTTEIDTTDFGRTHDSSRGGHFDVNKTLEKIWKRFYWLLLDIGVKVIKFVSRKRGHQIKRSLFQIFNFF